jgi:hypothetical protein
MSTQNRILGTVIVCVTLIALSIVGLASDFVTRLLSSIDGLLLLMICLMMAGIFSLMLFILVKEAGWLGKPQAVIASSNTPRPGDQPVQPNQATHPVAQARPAAESAVAKSAIKAGEGK